MGALKWCIITLLLLLAPIFLMQNVNTKVELHFLVWQTEQIPVTFPIFYAFLLGFLVSLVIVGSYGLRKRAQLKRCTRENRHLTQELVALRNLPLSEPEEPSPPGE